MAIGLVALQSCGRKTADLPDAPPPSHALWDTLLTRHVSTRGMVDYHGIITDSSTLNLYLEELSGHPPNSKWSPQEQLAYWINAYNAFTIKLIVDHYPVKSIRDLHPTLYVPLVNTVWHIKFFKIGGVDFNLDEIEHGILRKTFDEPRIHFAIVCASHSCPPLRNEAYLPHKIDAQLDDQAKIFINDTARNKLAPDRIEISQIFNWFKGDFTKKSTLIEFLNRYAAVPVQSNASIHYLDYDWNLNEDVDSKPGG